MYPTYPKTTSWLNRDTMWYRILCGRNATEYGKTVCGLLRIDQMHETFERAVSLTICLSIIFRRKKPVYTNLKAIVWTRKKIYWFDFDSLIRICQDEHFESWLNSWTKAFEVLKGGKKNFRAAKACTTSGTTSSTQGSKT